MTSFEDFLPELRAEAEREGPEAVAEFEALARAAAMIEQGNLDIGEPENLAVPRQPRSDLAASRAEVEGILEGLRALKDGRTHEFKIPPSFGSED